MEYSQNNRVASVTATAAGDTLLLSKMTGTEQLSRLFEYELDLLCTNGSLDIKALLGTSMTVTLALNDGDPRYFNGVVTRIGQTGRQGELYTYRAVLQPFLWLLTRASNCKVMPANNTVPDIIKAVLTDHGYTGSTFVTDRLQTTYAAREYCVQYRETDFNFISRLMEEEGIYYYFEHADGSHKLILCDDPAAHNPMPGNAAIDYSPASSGGGHDSEYISDWQLNQTIRSGLYTLNDYDFVTPSGDLKSTFRATDQHPQANSKEFYDYPGLYGHVDGGEHYAKARMQEQLAEFERIECQGNVQNLSAGAKFTLAGYPRSDQNREYLVIATQVQIQNNAYVSGGAGSGPDYRSVYEVMPAATAFRPPRITPKPLVQGIQTAVVVGEAGNEITTDEYGRVKVQFHWDRLGTKDANSSCWIRVAQLWAGKSWGSIYIPRIGQEVVVDFLEGNPDRPIIIGSVYNADQTVPFTLPDNKSQSGIKTRSTAEGTADNFNMIQFEDKKGSEQLNIQAEKDWNLVVKNNDTQTIGNGQSADGSQKIDIYNNRTVTIDQGNDQLTLNTGNRTTAISQGNDELTVSQGNRTTTISQGNDQLTLNSGNRTVQLQSGNHSLTLGSGNIGLNTDGGAIDQSAAQSITLTVGQNSITIDQQGITIKGLKVSIQGEMQAELKGAMTTVNADGVLTVKGSMVMIN